MSNGQQIVAFDLAGGRAPNKNTEGRLEPGSMKGRPKTHLDRVNSPNHVLILFLAVSFALLFWPAVAIDEFSYERAWVSAHFATMARNFMKYGILELGLVPVQTGGPLTGQPDYYYHWPPFFPVFLSWAFTATGQASVFVVHAIATILVACQAVIIGIWARHNLSASASLMAVLSFLNLPIVVKFAHAGLHLHLTFLLSLIAVFIFDSAVRRERDRPWLFAVGAAAYGLSCFTSWEPILIWPGLAVYWLHYRNRGTAHLLLSYFVAGFSSVCLTLTLYFTKYPDVMAGLFNRALFRAGISNYTDKTAVTIHDIGSAAPAGFDFSVSLFLENSLSNISQIGFAGLAILAVVLLCLRRKRMPWHDLAPALVLVPLIAMGAFWVVLMPQHFSLHDYQTLVFAAPAAIGVGILAKSAQDAVWSTARWSAISSVWTPRLLIGFGAMLIVMRLGIDIDKIYAFQPGRDLWVLRGEVLAREIPENGIVAVPWKDMVPTFYSDRHVIRGIDGVEMFEANRDRMTKLCPACPIFLVLDIDGHSAPQDAYETVWGNDRLRLLRVPSINFNAGEPSRAGGYP